MRLNFFIYAGELRRNPVADLIVPAILLRLYFANREEFFSSDL